MGEPALDDDPVELAEDEHYVVLRILAERCNEHGDMEYLVSWEGYQDVSWLFEFRLHSLTFQVRVDLGAGVSLRS